MQIQQYLYLGTKYNYEITNPFTHDLAKPCQLVSKINDVKVDNVHDYYNENIKTDVYTL